MASGVNRRQFVRSAGVAGVVALAGCDGQQSDGGGDGTSGETDSDTETGGSAGDTETDVTEITIWELFGGGDGEAFEQILDDFNEQHPDVEANIQSTEWDNYYGKLFTSMTGGNPPDLAIVHATQLIKFAPALTDLSEYISSETKNAYIDSLWSKTEIDGKRASLPMDSVATALYYNKDLFEEAGLDPESPPENWEEFKHAADAISSETDAAGFIPQPYAGASMLRSWFSWIRQKGGKLLNDDRSAAAFNTEAGLETMRTWDNMTDEWGWDKPDASGDRGTQLFRNGEAGMIWNGTWYVNAIKDGDYDWGMTKPFVADDLQNEVSFTDTHTLGVPKDIDEEKKQAAVTAAKWITQNSTEWGKTAGHLPASKKVVEGDALQNSQWWDVTLKTFSEMANDDQLVYLPRTKNQSEYKRAISKEIQQVYSQQKDPEQALDDAEQAVNRVLD